VSDIKTGDLVMIIKPTTCCGRSDGIGMTFSAGHVLKATILCPFCGDRSPIKVAVEKVGVDLYVEAPRLKKIDPPAEGDSLPTRRDLEVEA
jgi:hypothetical protein